MDVFSTDGVLLRRFTSGGLLNSPWGVALAPAGFGALSNDILIGNFGSGAINAYDLAGHFRGQVANHRGRPLIISPDFPDEYGFPCTGRPNLA